MRARGVWLGLVWQPLPSSLSLVAPLCTLAPQPFPPYWGPPARTAASGLGFSQESSPSRPPPASCSVGPAGRHLGTNVKVLPGDRNINNMNGPINTPSSFIFILVLVGCSCQLVSLKRTQRLRRPVVRGHTVRTWEGQGSNPGSVSVCIPLQKHPKLSPTISKSHPQRLTAQGQDRALGLPGRTCFWGQWFPRVVLGCPAESPRHP